MNDAVWSALSHPARRRVVEMLRDAPATTGQVHDSLAREGHAPSRFATQRHLQVLRSADLVLVTAHGRERYNALNGSALYQATIGWLRPADRSSAESLDRLRQITEVRPTTETGEFMPTPQHLLTEQAITIDAPRERVWRATFEETSTWWRPPYTILGGNEETILDLGSRVGDPVIERQSGREALWGTLAELEIGHSLAWVGRLCGADAATGTVRIRLDSDGESTRVTMRQEAFGYFADSMHDDVANGWQHKLDGLAAHVATTAS